MKRVLIYALSEQYSSLPKLVHHTLQLLKPVYSRIVLVSSGEPNANLIEDGKQLGQVYFTDSDTPAYWSLWKEGLFALGWNSLKDMDELHFLRDRTVGPLFDPSEWSQASEQESTVLPNQFFGLQKPETLMVFGNQILKSDTFKHFWEHAVPHTLTLDESKYMLHILRDSLQKSSFSEAFPYIRESTSEMDESNSNNAISPDQLVINRFPFLDLDNVTTFPHPQYLFDLLNQRSKYDISVLEHHLLRTYSPNEQLKTLNKNVLVSDRPLSKTRQKSALNLRIAIHIHVYYVDVGIEILTRFAHSGLRAEILLTSDSAEKLNEMNAEALQWKSSLPVVSSTVIPNQGRDMYAWVTLHQELSTYDIAGHFHTKKTLWSESWFGASWMMELMDSLIDPSLEIIELFAGNPQLGVVISDIPYVYKMKIMPDTWGKNRPLCTDLWKRMGCNPSLDFYMLDLPLMPFGNMYWYRPNALKPITNLKLEQSEFEQEPSPNDGTLAHTLERLPVYVAWSQGYDFRIILHPKHLRSTMDLYSRAGISQTITDLRKRLKESK